MSNGVYVVGGFMEIFELCELCGLDIKGYFDYKPIIDDSRYLWLGSDEKAKELYAQDGIKCVVISPDSPEVRRYLYGYYSEIGYHISSLVSPKAYVSPSSVINEGCIIQSFCNVSSNTILGKCVKMNAYANAMHDVCIDNYVTIAPGATLLGYVHVEESAYIGAGATIIERNRIGKKSVIGAGSVVTKDVEEQVVMAGVPARLLRTIADQEN